MFWLGLALFIVATGLAAVGVLLAGDPEGRGWSLALRFLLGAGALLLLDLVLVAFMLVQRFRG